jgi:hypothetical protein
MENDLEHLKLLSIFHYVLAGITGLFACFPVLHLAIGIMFLVAPEKFDGDAGNADQHKVMGFMFTVIPALFILTGWTIAVLVALAGRFLARRQRYIYCLVIAGVSCLFIPIGTVLGVFTIIVLNRPSVRALFNGNSQEPVLEA